MHSLSVSWACNPDTLERTPGQRQGPIGALSFLPEHPTASSSCLASTHLCPAFRVLTVSGLCERLRAAGSPPTHTWLSPVYLSMLQELCKSEDFCSKETHQLMRESLRRQLSLACHHWLRDRRHGCQLYKLHWTLIPRASEVA